MSPRIRPFLKCLHSRRASVVMQVGFALPIMITATLGVIEFGRVLWARSTLQFAAEEAARHAMITNGWTNDSLAALLRGRITGLDPSAINIQIVPETVGGIGYVSISASLPQAFVSYLGLNAVTVTGHARVPIAT